MPAQCEEIRLEFMPTAHEMWLDAPPFIFQSFDSKISIMARAKDIERVVVAEAQRHEPKRDPPVIGPHCSLCVFRFREIFGHFLQGKSG